MNKFLISYDLGGPEKPQDYASLITYIKEFEFWAKPLQSVWIVSTPKSSETIRDEMRARVDGNDKILVIEVGSDWATYNIASQVTDWMKDSL
jgi:hypothetical protein